MLKVKKIYCIKCNKYRSFKNTKISYTFEKTLVLSIIYRNSCIKCGNNDERIFKAEISIEIKNFKFLISLF